MGSIERALSGLALAGSLLLALSGCGDETERVQWTAGSDPSALHPAATPPGGPLDLAPAPPADMRLRAGRFLVATRRIDGPFFRHSVVLLLDYSRTGALGLIVNRPTDMSLNDLLPALGDMTDRDDRVFLGGPVETQMMVFLIRSESMPPESQRVIGDIHATGSADALRAIIDQGAPESRFHAYVGYAGWSPGQLDAEIAQGDWYVAPAEPDQVFDPSIGDLWERLVFEHEGTQVRAPHRTPADESARRNARLASTPGLADAIRARRPARPSCRSHLLMPLARPDRSSSIAHGGRPCRTAPARFRSESRNRSSA